MKLSECGKTLPEVIEYLKHHKTEIDDVGTVIGSKITLLEKVYEFEVERRTAKMRELNDYVDGRPRKYVDIGRVKELKSLGMSNEMIAEELGIGVATLYRRMNENNQEGQEI